MSNTSSRLTHRQVFSQSWPIMVANAAPPIVGLVDTLVIGRYAGTSALAGIGLGAVIYGIAYWAFSFLRMSTVGLAAQSDGVGDEAAVQAHLARALPLGMLLGIFIFVIQTVLLYLAFLIFTAEAGIEDSARIYIKARLWGLPAVLPIMALMGWFIGLGQSKAALNMQLVLNVVNIFLSISFVAGLKWGLYGVGIATSVSEWIGLMAGLWLARREINRRGGLRPNVLVRKTLLDAKELAKLGVANGNIFIRTLGLTIGFSFFGNAAATQGEVFLAGNHILLQFITIMAFFLDSFANVAEARAGAAYGARDRVRFDRAVRVTSEFSAVFAFMAAGFIYFVGPTIIDFMTEDIAVRESARTYLPFCALVPIIGFAAWQLDGIFIGVTKTRAMRNASLAALLIYLAMHYILQPRYGPVGIWIAFLTYYIARAITLLYYYPAIRQHLETKLEHSNR